MTLTNLKISTQLRAGLGLLLVLMALLGVVAWRQTTQIAQQTTMMYQHPLQVRRALGRIETANERVFRNLSELLLAKTDAQVATALQNIELATNEIEQQYTILLDRYLGPRSDLVDLHEDIIKANTMRTETIRLYRVGNIAGALARLHPGGAQYVQETEVNKHLKEIDDFAMSKGTQLYQEAMAQKKTLDRQLAVLVVTILLIAFLVLSLLQRAIQTPLEQLTAAAKRFRGGQLDTRSPYVSTNEFGTLSTAFNTMAETIEIEARVNEQTAQLAGIMLQEEQLAGFSRKVLAALLAFTGSQVGAIYCLNDAKSAFELNDAIGLSADKRTAFSARELEGEFGAALTMRQIQRIAEIPADTRFTFPTVSGEFTPREILTIPVLSEHEVVAVVSLATIRTYSESTMRLITDIWSMLNARVNGVLAFQRINELAARLEGQNRELEVQKQELAMQADELTAQNAELEMQKIQLAEANRLKSSFLSNMSHELRTPLNSVIALSGVLNRRLLNTIPDEECSYLEVIERNGKHLLALINDILDLSRIEAGRDVLNLDPCSLRELVGDVVAMLTPQAREKNLTLRNLVDDAVPLITTDPEKCRHILQNLIGNAVKFTEQGVVEVSARLMGDEVQVTVRDTGIGIAADQLPHIFDEFRQADDSASRKFGGTGLGLAIARKYAAMLHGMITVDSTLGRGSTFTLWLPCSLVASEVGAECGLTRVSPAMLPTPNAVANIQRATLLLIEDNEPVVIQMLDILAGQGYQVRVARSGEEALAQLAVIQPDAVILDLMMPEMDGFEVLQAIRAVDATAVLPVLILTAKHVTREELSFLTGNHIFQLIQKGDISKEALLTTVAAMVQPREAHLPVSRRARSRPADRPVILVVEDNPDNMRTARALLDDRYLVLEATDGLMGVELARQHHPDLILMDIALPVMDGIAALAALRADDELCDIPVVAVTASAMMGDREQILACGFDGYISKPIDQQALNQMLHEVFDGDENPGNTGN